MFYVDKYILLDLNIMQCICLSTMCYTINTYIFICPKNNFEAQDKTFFQIIPPG
jgi:hypothetical protein